MNRLLRDAVEETHIKRKWPIAYFYIEDEKENLYYMLRMDPYKNSSSIVIDYYFLKNGEMIKYLTGTGHVQKVYATVLKLSIEYINENKPEEFCFNSEKDHRKFNDFYSKAILPFFPDYTLKIYDELNLFLYTRTGEGLIEKDLILL